MSFAGFPVAALDFFDDLELDNTKSFWEAHKHIYADAVKAPMHALCASLEEEFGPAKVFRPYRQVRFSADKTPYKTHQGAYVGTAPETGYYVQISAQGVMTGAGFYWASPPRLASFRESVAEEISGVPLADLVASLEEQGFERGGERLKTQPRGYDASHPRLDLLRHKALTMSRRYGFDPVIHTAELADRVRADWRAYQPLVEWLTTRVAAE